MPEVVTSKDSEILQAEIFLGGVWDKTSKWLTDARGAQAIKTFGPSRVSEWERQSTYPPGEITLGIDIQKALLIRDAVNTYGVVLGRRKQSKYDQEKDPSLLFGFSPNSERVLGNYTEDTPVDGLRGLVNKGLFNNMRAEFYFRSDLHKIDVDCWIDAHQYGGVGLSRWERKDNIMSSKGERAILDTIKRLVRNFDPI